MSYQENLRDWGAPELEEVADYIDELEEAIREALKVNGMRNQDRVMADILEAVLVVENN